jgi:hypothetical protein
VTDTDYKNKEATQETMYCRLHANQISRKDTFIETESRLLVVWSRGGTGD